MICYCSTILRRYYYCTMTITLSTYYQVPRAMMKEPVHSFTILDLSIQFEEVKDRLMTHEYRSP